MPGLVAVVEVSVGGGKTLMDDQLLSMLGRSLHGLEVDLPGLDDLLVPRQACSGENAGKPPARRGSRPPVVVSVLDVKVATEQVLRRWVPLIVRDGQVPAPAPGLSAVDLARWLFARVAVIGDMPWGVMCAEEIIAQARLVADVVAPPDEVDAPLPLEVGGVREIVSWARLLGAQVSVRSVYRWIAKGVIASEVAPDGRVLVRLDDVLQKCRDQRNECVSQVF